MRYKMSHILCSMQYKYRLLKPVLYNDENLKYQQFGLAILQHGIDVNTYLPVDYLAFLGVGKARHF